MRVEVVVIGTVWVSYSVWVSAGRLFVWVTVLAGAVETCVTVEVEGAAVEVTVVTMGVVTVL